MPGLQDLVMALRSGLDPNVGLQLYDRISSDRQARQDELQAQLEEQQAEQEARRAARQEQAAGLGGMLIEAAQGGTPIGVARGMLSASSALPGMNLNPRLEGGLQDLLQNLYSRQNVPVSGREQTMTAAREGGAGQGPAAPLTRTVTPRQSPLYQPDPMAQIEAEQARLNLFQTQQELAGGGVAPANLADIVVPDLDRRGNVRLDLNTGKPKMTNLGVQAVQGTAEAKADGVSLEEAIAMARQAAGTKGYGPDVLMGVEQQIRLVWDGLPGPQVRVPAGPGQQATGGPARSQTAVYPRAGIQNTEEGSTWVQQLMDLLGFM